MSSDQRALFAEETGPRNGNGRLGQRLFVPKLLRNEALRFDRRTPEREQAYEIIKKWADLESTGKLLQKKERNLQGEFVHDVFGQALGYTEFSENLANWNLEQAFAVPDGEADAAIGFFSHERRDPPSVVIELKGPRANIDRDRSNGRTAVQQCWDYLNVLPECPWGIVCNYVSFRLYHRNKTPRAFEHFTLQELADLNRFRDFYYIFERGGFLPLLEGQQARCDALLKSSENQQRVIGDKFYTYYHEQRVSLINYLRRPPHNKAVDQAIHIAQKLLDRIVFIAFCEDRHLLNESTLDRTYSELGPYSLATNPRWENFKNLFRSMDKGNPRANVTAFNGGLFAVDPEVDNLELDDGRTLVFKEIGSHDFKDEINVEVLGHLFEQSITDLESLRIDPDAERLKAKTKPLGKRKREGVYYTPRHVTEYVVQNTLFPCLNEKFNSLAKKVGVDPAAPFESRNATSWKKYQRGKWEILKSLRVCDPACGSGAFLMEAYDFLEALYEDVVSELIALEDPQGDIWDGEIKATILRENLFGVDLSLEAVEITRLALWIRTAEKGESLTDLTENIRQGNSIVEDNEADSRAFDWQGSFPQVFAEGGFDCVIGNPPYVKLQNFRKREPAVAAHLIRRYKAAQTGNFDLYLPFIERGIELLKPVGRLGMIAPNVWLFNQYGAGLRELVADRHALERFVDFKSFQVFKDATTYTALQFFSAAPREEIYVADASHGELGRLQFYPVAYSGLGSDAWSLVDETDRRILDKMREAGVTLEDASEGIIVGIQTSADAIYHLRKLGPGRYYSKASGGEVEIEDEIMRPLVSGEDAVPFATPPTDTYLMFPYHVSDDECRLLTVAEMKRLRRAWEFLQEHEQTLRNRESSKFDDEQWYRFGRNQNIDKQHLPKLGVPQTVNRLSAFNDMVGERFFNNVRINGILPRSDGKFDLWYILALLNSIALDYFFRLTAKPKDRNYFEANRQFIAPLPIPKSRSQASIGKLAEKLSELHSSRLEIEGRVIRRFQVDFAPRELVASPLPPKIPGRLESFDTLSATERLDALEKFSKRRLRPAERNDWDEYLTQQSTTLAETKGKIDDAMRELNDRVYKLYSLTDEEIRHIGQRD